MHDRMRKEQKERWEVRWAYYDRVLRSLMELTVGAADFMNADGLSEVAPHLAKALLNIEEAWGTLARLHVSSLIASQEEGEPLKNVSADDLASAIRAAHAGRPTLAPEATQALIHAAARPPVPGQDLTPREREVLALMVQGLSNTAIASRLVVSPSTAKAHVSSILSKLGVTSRTEAVALAMQHHLVT